MAIDISSSLPPSSSSSPATEGNEDITTSPSPPTIEPVWFTDGNIFLKSEDTLFRVHQSVLSAHSIIFRQMLEIPFDPEDSATVDGPETKDGLPVVQLAGDSAEELSIFLRALYNQFRVHQETPKRSPAEISTVIAALLRLSTKYCVGWLRAETVSYAEKRYPENINDFMKQLARFFISATPPIVLPIAFEYEDERQEELAASVKLATVFDELELHVLHTRAIMHCVVAGFSVQQILETKLTPSDLRRTLLGREDLQVSWRVAVWTMNSNLEEYCSSPSPSPRSSSGPQCRTYVTELNKCLALTVANCLLLPIDQIRKAGEKEWNIRGALCEGCAEKLRAQWDVTRVKLVWEDTFPKKTKDMTWAQMKELDEENAALYE